MPPSALAPPGRVNLIGRRMPGCTVIFAQVIEYCERGHAAFPGRLASGQGEERDPPLYPSGGVPPHAA